MTEHERYIFLFERLLNKAYNSATNKQSLFNILNEDLQRLKQHNLSNKEVVLPNPISIEDILQMANRNGLGIRIYKNIKLNKKREQS